MLKMVTNNDSHYGFICENEKCVNSDFQFLFNDCKISLSSSSLLMSDVCVSDFTYDIKIGFCELLFILHRTLHSTCAYRVYRIDIIFYIYPQLQAYFIVVCVVLRI